MKRFILLTFILAFVSGDLMASPNDEIHVGTFNVWGSVQRDNQIKRGRAPKLRSWKNGRDAVAQMIIDADWDIFGVQEAGPIVRKELPRLVKRKGGKYKWWFAQPGDTRPGKDLANGIAYSRRFKMLDTDISWISTTPDRSSFSITEQHHKRPIATALMKDRRTGKLFVFTSTHGPLKGANCAEHAQILIDRIALFNKKGVPSILVGDMNAKPHQAFSAKLRTVYYDTQDIATKLSKVRGTTNGSRPRKGLPGPTCIDYIYVDRASGQHSVTEHNVFVNRYEIGGEMFYPSDHCPVGARIRLVYH